LSTLTAPFGKLRTADRAQTGIADLLAVSVIVVISAALVSLFLVEARRLIGGFGVPLDDAWIHYRIAENLANGLGFSYNVGQPTSASTSPAWTALLAVAYRFTGQFLLPSILLGAFFYLASNLAVYRIALVIKPNRWVALAAAVFTAVAGRWVWAAASGMETTLFTALVLWGILLLYAPRASRSGIAQWSGAALLCLASLVRPEAYLLLALAIGFALITTVMETHPRSVPALITGFIGRSGLILVIALVAAIALRLGYTLGTSGSLLGNTFLAQSLPQGNSPYTGPRLIPDFYYLRSVVQSLRSDMFLVGLLIPVGIIQTIRLLRTRESARPLGIMLVLWFVALPLFNSVISPNLRHHERYIMPLIPLAAMFGVFGIDLIVEFLAGAGQRIRIAPLRLAIPATAVFLLLATICLGDALFDTRRWAAQYAGDARNIQAINVQLGEWLRDNTPPDAYIAMNDIGATTFISKRRILDTVGIAEPELLPVLVRQGRAGVLGYLEMKRPDYLVIWPEWYPELAARSDLFTPVHSVTVDSPSGTIRSSMLGGNEMVVYRTNWPQP